jgi:hypothetical protein
MSGYSLPKARQSRATGSRTQNSSLQWAAFQRASAGAGAMPVRCRDAAGSAFAFTSLHRPSHEHHISSEFYMHALAHRRKPRRSSADERPCVQLGAFSGDLDLRDTTLCVEGGDPAFHVLGIRHDINLTRGVTA